MEQKITKNGTDVEEDKTQIIINSKYLAELSNITLQRWKQYGTPYAPLLGHEGLRKLLGCITQNKKITAVKIQNVPKIKGKAKNHFTGQRREHLLDAVRATVARNEERPVFWCAEAEIKGLLKENQRKDEGRVSEHLSHLPAQPSISSQVYAEWKLDRDRIRRVLNRL